MKKPGNIITLKAAVKTSSSNSIIKQVRQPQEKTIRTYKYLNSLTILKLSN